MAQHGLRLRLTCCALGLDEDVRPVSVRVRFHWGWTRSVLSRFSSHDSMNGTSFEASRYSSITPASS